MEQALAGKVVRSNREQVAMIGGPDEKRDFIFSSAQLRKYGKELFKARDGEHWAIAAHVSLGVLSDASEGEVALVSAATRDLEEAAKAAAAKHVLSGSLE